MMKALIRTIKILTGRMAAGLARACQGQRVPTFANAAQAMQSWLSDSVEHQAAVKNGVLAVLSGDGSTAWSGAAGLAAGTDQVPMTRDTPIYLASITKLYTATAIMRLYEQHRLSLEDPISQYLPKELTGGIHVYKGRDYSPAITLHHLLSHTSGIPDYYTGKPKGGKSLFELFLEDPGRTWTVEETIARAREDLTPHFPPGAKTAYSDTNFQLAGKVIEAVTGKALPSVFEEFFFRPLGLKHTWLPGYSADAEQRAVPAEVFHGDRNITPVRSNGSYWADGGMVATVEEAILFLKALNQGRFIRKETLKRMHHWREWEFPLQYGYGTMHFTLPRFMRKVMNVPPLWGHSGSTGSFLYYAEELDLYIAGLVNPAGSKWTPFQLIEKVLRSLKIQQK